MSIEDTPGNKTEGEKEHAQKLEAIVKTTVKASEVSDGHKVIGYVFSIDSPFEKLNFKIVEAFIKAIGGKWHKVTSNERITVVRVCLTY